MDSTTMLTAWEAWQLPLLPDWTGQGLARQGLWALVLGGAVSWLTPRAWPLGLRLALLALVLLWVALPGALSVSHWLGLAFKAPSLSSAALGLVALVLALRPSQRHTLGLAAPAAQPLWRYLRWLGVGLGWLLLLDLLALLPTSLYAWGFGTPALALVLLVLWLLAWRFAALPAAQPTLLLAAALLLLFVLTRWPSGNLWDALLDPLLWLGLQFFGLRALKRRSSGRGGVF